MFQHAQGVGGGGGWAWRIGTAKCEEHFLKRALAHYFAYLPISFKNLHHILPLQGEESPSGTGRLPRFCLLLSKTLRAIRSPCFRSLSCWRLFEFRAYEGNNFSKYQFSVDWLLIGLVAMNSSLPVEFYRQEDFGNGRQTLGDAQSLKTKNPLCIWDRCNQFNQFYR